MAVVAILNNCFTSGEAVAKRLASQLGYRLAEDDVIVEVAAALVGPGGPGHRELWDALEEPFTIFDRLTYKRYACLAAIQAAIAREVRGGNVICYGKTAYLLTPPDFQVVRVRITAPLEFRIKSAQARLYLSAPEANTYVRKQDRANEKWIRSLYGSTGADPSLHAVNIDLSTTSIEDAPDLIFSIVPRHSEPAYTTSRPTLDDWAISTLAKAQLALDLSTRNLEVETTMDCGLLSVSGRITDPGQLREIERVVAQVPGVVDINLNGIDVRSPSLLLAPNQSPFGKDDDYRPNRHGLRPVWLVMALLLCFVIGYSALVNKGASSLARAIFPPAAPEVQMFAGIITDTKCGPNHRFEAQESETQCVRACVKGDSKAKYALYDGKRLYVLSDQRTAATFAAHRVVIAGSLDEGTDTLAVHSIDLAL